MMMLMSIFRCVMCLRLILLVGGVFCMNMMVIVATAVIVVVVAIVIIIIIVVMMIVLGSIFLFGTIATTCKQQNNCESCLYSFRKLKVYL